MNRRLSIIRSKLAQMNCVSLDPDEIARCFAGCCAPNRLTREAIEAALTGALTMQDVRNVP